MEKAKKESTATTTAAGSAAKPVRGWYVLRAISGKEAQVKEIIEGAMRNTNLGDYVFQVLIPTEQVMTLRNGKKSIKERNLYSGYVFVECLLTGEVIHELSNTTNVIDFLRGRQKNTPPERLREAEVMRMLGAADEYVQAGNEYMVGEKVKVIDGPFKDFHGIIEEVNPEKHKLKVMIKIFDRKTPLELENSQVERE